MSERVAAIVVAYHPGELTTSLLASLREQVDRVFVIDNTPTEGTPAALQTTQPSSKVQLLRQHQNLGIATALNIGVREALAEDYAFIITFDQDSQVPPQFVRQMLDAYAMASRTLGDVAVVAPTIVDAKTGRRWPRIPCAGVRAADVEDVITSGALYPAKTFERVGGFADDYFIDLVDHEHNLRCLRLGLSLALACDVTLTHRLGDQVVRRLFGREITLTNHSPLRRYYSARNRVLTYRAYVRSNPTWVFRDVRKLVARTVAMALFERDRRAKLTSIVRGLADGIRGRSGPAGR